MVLLCFAGAYLSQPWPPKNLPEEVLQTRARPPEEGGPLGVLVCLAVLKDALLTAQVLFERFHRFDPGSANDVWWITVYAVLCYRMFKSENRLKHLETSIGPCKFTLAGVSAGQEDLPLTCPWPPEGSEWISPVFFCLMNHFTTTMWILICLVRSPPVKERRS